MINLDLFFEKFPELAPNDEWLVLLNENFIQDNYRPDWYLYKWYFLPFSKLYFSIWNFYTNPVVWDICALKWENKVYIKFDFNEIVLADNHPFLCGGVFFWFPEFNLEKLSQTSQETLSVKERRNKKFDEILNNKIFRTEFLYNPRFYSLQIEEIADFAFWKDFFQRFYHSTFDVSKWTVSHLDWKILIYNSQQIKARKEIYLDKHCKIAQQEIKMFRVDGSIDISTWSFLTNLWYSSNELVLEWLDPKEYVSLYENILDPEIDWTYNL